MHERSRQAGGTASGRLQIGLLLPSWDRAYGGADPRWTDLVAMARRAEDVGFDSLWCIDHPVYHLGDIFDIANVIQGVDRPISAEIERLPPSNTWDCWTLLSALAATTERVTLGTLVSCTGFRNPVVTAKMADTLDEVSAGRFILGLGAGDAEREHRYLGVPYEGRIGRFEESVRIIRALLDGETVSHDGEHFTIDGAVLTMRGPSPQGPPLLIGSLGTGPRMLRLVAQHASIWNGFLAYGRSWPDVLPPLREAIDAACERHGRYPATLGRAVTIAIGVLGEKPRPGDGITGTTEKIAEALRTFVRGGVTHVQIFLTPNTLEGIEAFAPVLEALDRQPV